MEGIFFLLIGGTLFAQSWYVLGLYSDGRTMGVFTGGLGIASLITLTLSPMLLLDMNVNGDPLKPEFVVASTMVMKSIIILWAVYAVGIAAHGILDFDERPIGLYGAFLAVATAGSFLYFATKLSIPYGDGIWLGISGVTLLLTLTAGVVFFYLTFGLNILRLLTGWFALLGGGVIAFIGLAAITTLIS